MSTPTTFARRDIGGYRKPVTGKGPVLAALLAGLVLTVVATIIPYLDRATLADHVRAGYPHYSDARIDTAVTTYLVYLTLVGVLGAAGWLWSLRTLETDLRWARGVATALFLLGLTVALVDLLIKDTSGDTGLPPLLGWVGLLPALPGLLAVTLLWRQPRPRSPRNGEST